MRLLVLLLLTLCSGQAISQTGLNILLTNDDGWDSPGLMAVRKALVDVGHTVTVVAPLSQQSGTGMKITMGVIEVVEQQPGVWSVDGSPADAVGVALDRILGQAPPDLVVSGANFGQNLGNNVMISGTVGAAMVAVMRGIPALAVSVGLDLAEAKAEPRFASTTAAFPGAAGLVARLVTRLSASATGQLLPPRTILNLNYPAGGASPAGIVWAPVSDRGGFVLSYVGTDDGGTSSTFGYDVAGQQESDTDTGRFAAGYATLSVLTPDWNAVDIGRSLAALGELGALLSP